jgi:hypothetical protein
MAQNTGKRFMGNSLAKHGIGKSMGQARNPNQGRHFMGTPIGSSGPTRTGSPSGYWVGTGVNRKTAARPEHQPSRSSASTNYTRQAQQFVKQAPEPFRNPARGANPLGTVQRVPNPEGTAAPGVAPRPGRVASPYAKPMSQAEMNRATGHAANYKPAGYYSATSGFPTQAPRRAGNPASQARSNQSTPGGKLMAGLSIGGRGRGVLQGPGFPSRLLGSKTPKGPIPRG